MTVQIARRTILGMTLALLAACGSGEGEGDTPLLPSPSSSSSSPPSPSPSPINPSGAEAARFLTQTTFGPTKLEIDKLKLSTLETWINNQQAIPQGEAALTHLLKRLAEFALVSDRPFVSAPQFYEYFWREAVTAQDQLRQRVRFALSEIFVISLVEGVIDIRGAASYYDMLGKNSFGNFRTLLEEVTLHPMMGRYLSHLGNAKEDPSTGRTPDENYAREVMQLMSIGLYELNLDGTIKLDNAGNPIPTYDQDDIAGLASVFTGFSWYSRSPSDGTFKAGSPPAEAFYTPMIAYNNFHSTASKTFLNKTIPASTTPDAMGDLKIALDTIFNHPNVGPFIGKQLIQRLVTSNPSPDYVRRVATVFNNNGSGVRGDLAAVVRAILLDPEARTVNNDPNYGKLREPILRLTALFRAFGAKSTSGNWEVRSTSASTVLGQSPLTSPSVFNFFRPGYVQPGSKTGAAGLVVPELQITDEVTVAGYANTIQTAVTSGLGYGNDIQIDLTSEIALARDPAALVDRLNTLLLYGSISSGLRQRVLDAVNDIAIPSSATTTPEQVATALKNRASVAVYLIMVSPDFLVQR